MLKADQAKLEVVLNSEQHTISEVRLVVDALDGLWMAGMWGAIITPNYETNDLVRARDYLRRAQQDRKAPARFYPEFFRGMGAGPELDEPDFEPSNPMDAAVRDGMNSYLRRILIHQDPDLYQRMFSFATVAKVEYRSPLLIEMAIVVGAMTLPVVLTFALARAAVAMRKANAEVSIRETEAKIRQEELKQKEIQTRVLEHVEEAVRELDAIDIPKEAMTAAAQVSTTAISDLSSKPLIGSLTFGVSTKS